MFKRKRYESRNKSREFNILSNTHDRFISNFIKTSKYNLLTFLPKAIFIQFKRYANIYFLAAAILQSIPSISPLNPFTAIAPFVLVITLSILREGLEDYPRHKSDRELNANITHVIIEDGNIMEISWANIEVGQLIYLQNEEMIPADLILIRSSNNNNFCFIETASLDGEKNLKPKICHNFCRSYINDSCIYDRECISKWKVYAPAPDPMLYKYEGYLTLENGDKIPITHKQLLLRGSKVKNTKWAIGIVVYTGMDTKIMKNADKSKYKQSTIENMTNKLIIFILICQLTLCAITSIGNTLWLHYNSNNHWYLGEIKNFSWESTRVYLASFLLYNTMIPISLIVSLEFVKLIQAYFIQEDEDLYVFEKNRKAKVFTVSINEELGQVSYIFSDKTGTLTCNQMEFKACVIGDEAYGNCTPKAYIANEDLETHDSKIFKQNLTENPTPNTDEAQSKFSDEKLQHYFNDTISKKILMEMKGKKGQNKLQYAITSQRNLVYEFWEMISICHECVIETMEKTPGFVYQSASPDEVTLVESARDQGFVYKGIHDDIISVNIFGKDKQWKLLKLFEFTSDRKRMTIIVKDGNLIKMYIKGADSIIKNRLRRDYRDPNLAFIEEKLKFFSNLGLRTLVYAMRIMEENEYAQLEEKFNSLIDAQNREEKLLEVADQYENDFYLIGVTAVEDKLQRNVPQVIHNLLRARIKMWMLTGDKLETAENIAYSCKLFTGDMTVIRLAETEKGMVIQKMKLNYEIYNECVALRRKIAFIVEGDSLAILLESPDQQKKFLEFTAKCTAVVCCRASPKQKAQIVRLIKESTGKITLAIGDGANDVNMIQEANIGIGIYGNEGMRAVQASDYAIGEFQGLFRLLIVHGRWCYIRIAEMIMYFFYKNMIFTLPAFYFAFLTGFSSSTIYDDWYWSCYNMIFTALPLIIKAVFEQDFNYKMPLVYLNGENNEQKEKSYQQLTMKLLPLLYYIGQKNIIFKKRNFLLYLGSGAIQGVLIFTYAIYGLSRYQSLDEYGYNSDMWYFSISIYTTIFLVVNMKLTLTQRYWTWINFISLFILSIGIYLLFQFVYDIVPRYNRAAYTIAMLYSTSFYYLFIVFCMGLILIYEYISLSIFSHINKDMTEQLRILLHSNINQYIKIVKKLCSDPNQITRPLSQVDNKDLNIIEQQNDNDDDHSNNTNTNNKNNNNTNAYKNNINKHHHNNYPQYHFSSINSVQYNTNDNFLRVDEQYQNGTQIGFESFPPRKEKELKSLKASTSNNDGSSNDTARNNILKNKDFDEATTPIIITTSEIKSTTANNTNANNTNNNGNTINNKIVDNIPNWERSDDIDEVQYSNSEKSFINKTKYFPQNILSKNHLVLNEGYKLVK